MGWREIVEQARGEENKEVAALVLTDKGLQKLLAAWPLARIVLDDRVEDAAGIDDVLACMHVDAPHMLQLTGMQMGGLMKAFERARALRLVYPDNTIHGMGLMVVRKIIQDALAG